MIHKQEKYGFETFSHEADLCVVGGGLAGMFAAVSAARHGCRVLLMQDRPVLGGNASSEIRMWIRGAHGENNRETGLLEELALENIYRNPRMNFSIWDSILYEKVRFQENIELLLNCSCCEAQMQKERILSVTGWQTTTQSWHRVTAKLFADCSGDSVLAPLTGAEFRMGREASSEFGEDIAPLQSDEHTMGMSCLIQARETAGPVSFIPPDWAYKLKKEDFKNKIDFSSPVEWAQDNFWWLELGGIQDSIADTEQLRDELLKTAYGTWDFIKNSGEVQADNWELEWLGMLPGKRESRRYVGDYILSQQDVRSEGKFEDVVAYGGWTMDDHHPMGFATTEPPTVWHPAPSPFGIPYRCLYSRNIENLMFAGRNISATHTALSSCRVMATCGLLGQALGTAASIAIREGLSPRGVYEQAIPELQQTLMLDDCFLPLHGREPAAPLRRARLSAPSGNAELLRNGLDRPCGENENCWEGEPDEEILLDFGEETKACALRLFLDSDLNRRSWGDRREYLRLFPMRCNLYLDEAPLTMPGTLLRSFAVYADSGSGQWQKIFHTENNRRRLVVIPLSLPFTRLKIRPIASWGGERVRIFSVDVR